MGLTNENPKVAIETIKALAEMARGFKLFEKYGIEKLVKDAHTLSEAEQRKLDEAKASIAKYESLIVEDKELRKQMDSISAQHAQTVQSINAERESLAKKEAEIKKAAKDLVEKADEIRLAKEAVSKREIAVSVAQSRADQEMDAAKAVRNEYENLLLALKSRSNQLKEITEGL